MLYLTTDNGYTQKKLKKLCNKRNVSHKTLSRRRFTYGFCVVVIVIVVVIVVVRRMKVVSCTECNYAKC